MYAAILAPENHFQAIKTILKISHHITLVIEVDHPNKDIHEISHKIDTADQIVVTTINYLFQHPVPTQCPETDTISTTDHEIHHTIEIGTIQTTEIEVTQTTEIKIIQIIDHKITHIIDQTITDQTTIIKTDHEIIHKIDIQVIITVIEIIPNHHTGIITIIIILTIATEVVHLNIKEILIKYNQTQKQHQTPQVLITQEITNYN